jgi:hypothetical protein
MYFIKILWTLNENMKLFDLWEEMDLFIFVYVQQ